MAESFRALGAGNGFPFCLVRRSFTSDEFHTYNAGNVPTLNETMQAYWNIESVSYGGASITVNSEPKDLICDPNANNQNDVYVESRSPRSVFSVSIGRPYMAVVNGEEYLAHGIYADHYGMSGDSLSETSTIWRSTAYNSKGTPYTCSTVYGNTGTGGSPTVNNPHGTPDGGFYPTHTHSYEVGKVAYQTKVTNGFYSIMGLPFTKTVIQSSHGEDYGENSSCPSLDFLPSPSNTPLLSFKPYF